MFKPIGWPRGRNRRALTAIFAAFAALAALLGIGTSVSTASATTQSSIFTTQTPATAVANDSNAVELGVKFQADYDGTVTGIRFFKGGTANGGTHVGHLWTTTGTQLGSVTFTGETSSGWQTATFATPIAISASTTYIASYYAPLGHYSYTSSGMTTAVDNPPLHALASSASGGNDVYTYTTSASGAFPSSSYNATNYFVDLLFVAGGSTSSPSASASSSPSASPSTSPSSSPSTSPSSSPSASPSSSSTGSSIVNIWPTGTPVTPKTSDVSAVNLGVKFTSDVSGYVYGVRFYKGDTTNGGTHIGELWDSAGHLLAQGTFTGETSSGWQDLQFTNPFPITANTTYVASYYAPQGHYAADSNGLASEVSNPPLHALASGGVYSTEPDLDPAFPINTVSTNYWVDVDFSTATPAPVNAPQPTPRAGVRGSGPVLVLTDPTVPFTDDVCAILQAEGLPECAATDTANLNSSFPLSGYRAVILADGAPLTSTQVSQITTWTTNGGNFIALRPNDNLDTLLGVGSTIVSATLPDAYYQVDTTQAPGAGIVGQTMQYHGLADEHPLNGARAIATLYSTSTTATAYPAVTTNVVGSGWASAYAFDPAQSIIWTRNGNPGFSGEAIASPNGQPRLGDRFAGGYLDTTKAAIPQADELAHLLVNQVEQATSLPRLWYLPTYQPSTHPGGLLKAAFVLTGDDHDSGSSQTLNRFAAEQAASPAGCSVADWECFRSTSYAYAGSFSDAAAKPYTDEGFEVSLHAANGTNCLDWTSTSQLSSLTNTALSAWQTGYPTISAAYPPLTERYHCYGVQREYTGIANEEASLGILADTNTSSWPPSAFGVAQCLISGTAIPMPYASQNGTLTNEYQLTTQATDENANTTATSALTTLMSNAIGPDEYYGYYTVLAHLDDQPASNQAAQDVLNIAQADNVPVISAAQATKFMLDRANTSVSGVAYGTNTVTYTVANPAHNLEMLVPVAYGSKTLSGLAEGSTTLSTATQVTINGTAYATVAAATAGSYVATYN